MTVVLLFKLLTAPLLVAAATLISRRYGAAAGGWIAGFPLTSGPVSLIFALEHGRAFAADAATATTAGSVSVIAFAFVYVICSRSLRAAWCLLLAIVTFGAISLVALRFPIPAPAALAIVVIGSLAALRATREARGARASVRPAPAWDLPARMGVTALLVFLLFKAAARFGAHVAGVLSPFPLFASILAVFTHAVAGAEAARSLLRGVIAGTVGFATFFVVVALLLRDERLTIAAVYAAATVAALLANLVTMRLTGR